MSDFTDHVERMAKIIFRGEEAAKKAQVAADGIPSISISDLVAKKSSLVTCDGKLYRVMVEEVVFEK
jgi:hypothetical protein